MSGTTVRDGRFMYIDWENGRRERINRSSARGQPDVFIVEQVRGAVKHFVTGGTRDHDAISRVVEQETPAGLVKRLRAATTQAEAERIIALTPNYRLALVADRLGIPIDPDWDTPTARKAIARIVTERRRGGEGSGVQAG